MISQRSLIFGGGSARLIFTPVIGLAAFNPLFEHIISSAMQKLETFFHECMIEGEEAINNMTREPAENVARILIGSVALLPALTRVEVIMRPQINSSGPSSCYCEEPRLTMFL